MSGEQLIGDVELGLSASERPDERPESAAVSRRPTELLDRTVMERLSRRTNVHGLAYFLGHYALIGLGGWLCWTTFPGPLFWPVFAFQAVVTGFLFSPLHECAHGSAFRSRWLNETALWITALVYVVPPYYFRYFHLGHHRFTQVPGKDPSLVLPEPANFGQYLWYCAGLWFWWRNLSWMVKHACGFVHPASATYVPAGRCGLMVIESRIMVLLYAALFSLAAYFGFTWVLIVAWIAPPGRRRAHPEDHPGGRARRMRGEPGSAAQHPHDADQPVRQRNRVADAVPRRASPVSECAVSRASCRARARWQSGGGGAARLSRRPAADHPAPARRRFHRPARRRGSSTAAVARAARRVKMACLPVTGLLLHQRRHLHSAPLPHMRKARRREQSLDSLEAGLAGGPREAHGSS